MKDVEWKERFALLTSDDMKIINRYMDNDMKKLKWLVNKYKPDYNNGNHRDQDLLDDAMNVLLESVISYDGERAKFETFLIGNIKRSFQDWYRDNYLRAKRSPLLLDKDGKIVKKEDENGKLNPVQLQTISIDAPVSEDETDLTEKIASDFDIEDESDIYERDEKVNEFINSLSTYSQKILNLKMNGYDSNEIKDCLKISEAEYHKYIKEIKTSEKLELFAKTEKYKEDIDMNIMPIDVTDSYRMDKYPLGTLLDEKRDKKMNCEYILQRKPFQWTKKQKNKFLTRILNNQPIPEIVICEQMVKDKKKRHLIDGLQRLSYSAQYRAKGSVIEAEGAEFPDIYYTEYVTDENGEYILDEDGDPKVEKKVFNVIGKKFDELPPFLQERFNKFNINVTTFFNCTDEQIAYHLRNYNNQAPMNNNQYDLSCMNPEVAEMVKNISQNNLFFKDKYGKYTNSNDTKGALDRLVMESIMSINFLSDWKDKTNLIFPYVEEHATKDMFKSLNDLFARLCNVVTKETKELFNTSNTPTWIAVFNEFSKYGLDDRKFKEFIEYVNENLSTLVIDGEKFEELYKNTHPKNKGIITPKITKLISFMKEFLHIDTTEVENNAEDTDICFENSTEIVTNGEESVLDFVKENADPKVTEDDVELYQDMVEDCVRIDEPVYKECGKALIALMAYACLQDKDQDFEKWIDNYRNKSNFSPSQKVNFTYMKQSFDNYTQASA